MPWRTDWVLQKNNGQAWTRSFCFPTSLGNCFDQSYLYVKRIRVESSLEPSKRRRRGHALGGGIIDRSPQYFDGICIYDSCVCVTLVKGLSGLLEFIMEGCGDKANRLKNKQLINLRNRCQD